jgi:hypothetical protein
MFSPLHFKVKIFANPVPLQEIDTVLYAIFMVKFEIFSLKLGSIPGNRGEKSGEPALDSDKCLSWLLWFSRLSTLRRTEEQLGF